MFERMGTLPNLPGWSDSPYEVLCCLLLQREELAGRSVTTPLPNLPSVSPRPLGDAAPPSPPLLSSRCLVPFPAQLLYVPRWDNSFSVQRQRNHFLCFPPSHPSLPKSVVLAAGAAGAGQEGSAVGAGSASPQCWHGSGYVLLTSVCRATHLR